MKLIPPIPPFITALKSKQLQTTNHRNSSNSARLHKTNTPQMQSLPEKGLQMKAVKETKIDSGGFRLEWHSVRKATQCLRDVRKGLDHTRTFIGCASWRP